MKGHDNDRDVASVASVSAFSHFCKPLAPKTSTTHTNVSSPLPPKTVNTFSREPSKRRQSWHFLQMRETVIRVIMPDGPLEDDDVAGAIVASSKIKDFFLANALPPRYLAVDAVLCYVCSWPRNFIDLYDEQKLLNDKATLLPLVQGNYNLLIYLALFCNCDAATELIMDALFPQFVDESQRNFRQALANTFVATFACAWQYGLLGGNAALSALFLLVLLDKFAAYPSSFYYISDCFEVNTVFYNDSLINFAQCMLAFVAKHEWSAKYSYVKKQARFYSYAFDVSSMQSLPTFQSHLRCNCGDEETFNLAISDLLDAVAVGVKQLTECYMLNVACPSSNHM